MQLIEFYVDIFTSRGILLYDFVLHSFQELISLIVIGYCGHNQYVVRIGSYQFDLVNKFEYQ